MSLVRRYINFVFALGLGAGLLFAQVCNVVCLTANCTEAKKIVTSPPSQPSSHCHNSSSETQPEPEQESHSCQNHDLTLMPTAKGSQFDIVGQMDWQLSAIVPVRQEVVFTRQAQQRNRLSSLRSPPRLPQRLILRI